MYMGGEGTHAIVSTKALQSIAMGVRHKKKTKPEGLVWTARYSESEIIAIH